MWVDYHACSLQVDAQTTAGVLWQWHGIAISKFAHCNGQHRYQGKRESQSATGFASFAHVKRLHLTGSGEAERYHGTAAESCPTLPTSGA